LIVFATFSNFPHFFASNLSLVSIKDFNLKFFKTSLVNDKILKNSENKLYLITGNKYKMLSLYEDDCQNGIPEKTYLLLGNLISGSMDSTQFGLVSKHDILGKVEY